MTGPSLVPGLVRPVACCIVDVNGLRLADRPASAIDRGSEKLLPTVFISLVAWAELGVSGIKGVGDALVGGVGRQSMQRT
jgi:hypothetical protein